MRCNRILRLLVVRLILAALPEFAALTEGERGGVPDEDELVYRDASREPGRECLSTEDMAISKDGLPPPMSLLSREPAETLEACDVLPAD
jgi:hypothetical protein